MFANSVDSIEYYGNLIEAVFWIAMGAGFLISAIWPAYRGMKVVAAVALVVFGVSDFVEAHTGAWWRPWWLMIWKGACNVAFLVLLIIYYRGRRERASAAAADAQTETRTGAGKVDS